MSETLDLLSWTPKPVTGQSLRDGALNLLETTREDYVTRARAAGVAHAMRFGVVTINDVRAACPPPNDIDPRVMGAVLRAPLFVKIGYENSNRSTCHARPIAKFKLKDQ